MATVETESPAIAPSPESPNLYRLSAEAFFRAVEHDIFPVKSRVYLWDGILYEKPARTFTQAVATETALLALSSALAPGWSLWTRNPILVDDFTAPLPDLCVVRGTARDYFARRSVPKLAEIGVVIELSDATLRVDVTKSLAKYAGASLPVYWVVNLVDWRVEVHSSPVVEEGVATYSTRDVYEPGRDVLLVLDGVEVARVAVTAILPAEKGP